MFDMTQVKIGDKLLTRDGEVVELWSVEEELTYPYTVKCNNGCKYTVQRQGLQYWYPDADTCEDIVGFAASQPEPVTENKGVKSDQGKTQWSYLPITATKAVVEVMMYGDAKYPAPDGSNWKRVPNAKKRYYNAAMRHMTAWWDGEQNDPETGYNHLAHACSNLLFLLWFEIKGYPKESN